LKILLTNSTDIYGGGEFYVLELAMALRSRHHDVLVVCKPANLLYRKCLDAQLPVRAIDFPGQGKLLRHILLLRDIIREDGIQIVHTNSNYDRTAGAFAARLSGAVHVTNVHSFHSLRHNLTHWLRNARATDHYIVDGDCVKEMMIRQDRISPARISVIHLGVDPDSMRPDITLRSKIREEFGLAETNLVIGNVARLVPFKGHEYLLRSFEAVRKNNPGARLLLVGDGELKEELLGLAGSLGIEREVHFAGFRDDLRALYSAFDIYAHASIEGGGETFPFSVLQALSQELPVVATRVGDVAAMVQDGLTGFLVPERDVPQLAQSLSVLSGDPALRATMGREGRKFLLRQFTTDMMVSAIEKIYESALQHARR
jgi:glycosyltransferase involved in cell wall biosynthesis